MITNSCLICDWCRETCKLFTKKNLEMGNNRYNHYNRYRLVNDGNNEEHLLMNEGDSEMEDVDFGEPRRKFKIPRFVYIFLIVVFVVVIIIFFLAFILFPLVFMSSKTIQTNLIFTRFFLSHNKTSYATQRIPSYENRYLKINHTRNGENISLGVWHILPVNLAYRNEFLDSVNFDEALLNSDYSVLIYFHGTGEARSYNKRKYELFLPYFHVIAFDYRGYADSSKGTLTEQNLVDDCIELCKWVRNRTNSDIYIWGHSLGAALGVETVAILENKHNITSKGLIVESAFTNLQDELYVHPYTKIFTWLPWFKATVVDPLRRNGFLFETDKHISTITCPIMILHAQDDPEIPCKFGEMLFEIAYSRKNAITIYYQFEAKERYGHTGIYTDAFMKLYLMNFMLLVNNATNSTMG